MAVSESEKTYWFNEINRRFGTACMDVFYNVRTELPVGDSILVRVYINQFNDATYRKVYYACERVKEQLKKECPLYINLQYC